MESHFKVMKKLSKHLLDKNGKKVLKEVGESTKPDMNLNSQMDIDENEGLYENDEIPFEVPHHIVSSVNEGNNAENMYGDLPEVPDHIVSSASTTADETFVKKPQCEICNATFTRKNDLKIHIATIHEGKKPESVTCEICNTVFTQKKSLNSHIAAVHEGKKPYEIGKEPKCEICNAVFTRKKSLNSHIAAVHEGKKPHQCNLCERTFARRFALTSHFAKYHPDYDYEKFYFQEKNCEIKEKKKRSKSMKQLMEDQKKPYKCHICGYASTKKGALTTHFAKAHEG